MSSPTAVGERARSKSVQQRSRMTRSRLIEEATALFASRGFDAVTVDQIARASGVAKGTFYFHFDSKEDLLLGLFFQGTEGLAAEASELVVRDVPFPVALDRMAHRIAARTSRLPKHLVRRVTQQVLAHADRAPGQRPGTTSPREAIHLLVAAGQQRGEITDTYGADEIAMAVNWAILQGLLLWSTRPQSRPSLESVLRRRLHLEIDGLAPNSA